MKAGGVVFEPCQIAARRLRPCERIAGVEWPTTRTYLSTRVFTHMRTWPCVSGPGHW